MSGLANMHSGRGWSDLAAFLPLYILGFMGATRRLDHYDASTGWQPLFLFHSLEFVLSRLLLGYK